MGVWGHLGHGAALLLVFGASVVWDAGVEAAVHCGGCGMGRRLCSLGDWVWGHGVAGVLHFGWGLGGVFG